LGRAADCLSGAELNDIGCDLNRVLAENVGNQNNSYDNAQMFSI
jgi:hypothetical protein